MSTAGPKSSLGQTLGSILWAQYTDVKFGLNSQMSTSSPNEFPRASGGQMPTFSSQSSSPKADGVALELSGRGPFSAEIPRP